MALFEIEGRELSHRPEEDAKMQRLFLNVQNYKFQIKRSYLIFSTISSTLQSWLVMSGLYLECSGMQGDVTGQQGIWGTEIPPSGVQGQSSSYRYNVILYL